MEEAYQNPLLWRGQGEASAIDMVCMQSPGSCRVTTIRRRPRRSDEAARGLVIWVSAGVVGCLEESNKTQA